MIETYFEDPRAVLLRGEALDALRLLPDDSVDALVTDPPAGISFMSKGWDSDKGGRDKWIAWLAEIMREVLRVLKPGAHGLVWALPRTSHWTATALENAGFEIRDVHMHVFGTGFPKSLDVSKAIDANRRRDFVQAALDQGIEIPDNNLHDWTKAEHAPGNAWWSKFKERLAPEQWLSIERVVIGERATGIGTGLGATSVILDNPQNRTVTAPATPEAAAWAGWGTALKPAVEHWILARKPLAGTVANNVLEHGTGALNIDACRIGVEGGGTLCSNRDEAGECLGHGNAGQSTSGETFHGPDTSGGRWPAHVSFDEEAASVLDEMSGVGQSSGMSAGPRANREGFSGPMSEMHRGTPYRPAGGASRFFYVAKGSRSEKDLGCEHLPARTGGEATDREEGSAGLSNPRAGAGRTGGARNHHPTIKSIALMRWLCRLITPGVVFVCDRCQLRHYASTKAPGRAKDVPDLQVYVPCSGQRVDVLQQTVCESGTSHTEGTPVRAVHKGVSPDEGSRSEVLQQEVFVQVAGSETTNDKRFRDHAGGLSSPAIARAPAGHEDGVHTRTSCSDDRSLRQSAASDRNSASQEWAKAGQSSGKSRGDGQAEARQVAESAPQADSLSPLQRADRGRWRCSSCEGIVRAERALVLDCFAGSGSTGVAALHEGFQFLGVERDLDDATGESLGYCEITKARLIRALADTAKEA